MKTQKVLVVEDDPELLSSHAGILAAEGYRVLRASTGEDALRVAAGEKPDLVLLDAVLPDGDGVEVCGRMKADPALQDVFVVMLSGKDTTAEHQAEALHAGADGYLAKPIESVALKAHVLAFLRIRQNEEDLRESSRLYREQAEALREANRRLEEYNRLKAEFVANMSHELRTPLTAIIGFAQLTRAGDGEMPKRYVDAFERILRNGQHLLALINDVLDVSKIEAGRMKIHREHVDLVEVVQGAFAELQSLAERKGLQYRLRVPERLPLAYTDPLRVRQVVINLLSNAAKFTSRGAVEAELTAHGELHFRIVVRDTGIGIEEESLGFIFERFRQVDGSMTRSASGVGLGLSIVRQIVDLLGGEIEVTSSVGEGSTFVVTLPLTAPEPGARDGSDESPRFAQGEGQAGMTRAAESAASGAEEEGGDGRPVVIVIEDDEDAAALLEATLTRAGYRVLTAPNGERGLRLAREHDPVAVTLDVMMPEMDGWRVLQSMRADRRLASVPVIVCSIVDNRPLGYSLGASDYLVKPVDPAALTDTLDRVSVRGGDGDDGDDYILVIDDEHGVRELLTMALRHAGFNARSAPSGETALKIAGQRRPRAVLCDLMMPNGMSGFEFIARFRSDARMADVPVLVVTGRDVTPDDRALISGEIADVIRKGELLLSDVASRLRDTLEELGVEPSNGEDTVR